MKFFISSSVYKKISLVFAFICLELLFYSELVSLEQPAMASYIHFLDGSSFQSESNFWFWRILWLTFHLWQSLGAFLLNSLDLLFCEYVFFRWTNSFALELEFFGMRLVVFVSFWLVCCLFFSCTIVQLAQMALDLWLKSWVVHSWSISLKCKISSVKRNLVLGRYA